MFQGLRHFSDMSGGRSGYSFDAGELPVRPFVVADNDGWRPSCLIIGTQTLITEPTVRRTTRNSRLSDKRAANTAWGWLVAAVLTVAVLAVAFGLEHRSGQTGINTATKRRRHR